MGQLGVEAMLSLAKYVFSFRTSKLFGVVFSCVEYFRVFLDYIFILLLGKAEGIDL